LGHHILNIAAPPAAHTIENDIGDCGLAFVGFIRSLEGIVRHAIGKLERDMREVFAPKLVQEIIAEVRQAIEAQRAPADLRA